MTIDASTSASAATARIVVCSNPRAANIARAARRMARRVPSDRGPPIPGTGSPRPTGGTVARLLCVTTAEFTRWGTRGRLRATAGSARRPLPGGDRDLGVAQVREGAYLPPVSERAEEDGVER